MSESFPEYAPVDPRASTFYIDATRRAMALRRLRARDSDRRMRLAASQARAAHAATLAAGRPR